MLEEAGRRKSRGSDVVIATADGHGLEPVTALLDGLEEIGDGGSLDVSAVLARKPDVVCIDDLAVVDDGETRLAAARRIADAGINIISTVHVASLSVDGGPGAVDEAEILAFADEIELVDAPPSVLADRIRRGEVVPDGGAEAALSGEYAPQALEPLREQAFAMVAEHAERRLAGYEIHSGDQLQPVILACTAPRPGMEPLIRRSAALAAKLAGDFLTASVAPQRPESALDGYRALTEQLGGEFTMLTGPPAATLMTFAKSRHVTEMVLAPTGAGRHLVLRELARGGSGVELHILPIRARTS
jgi:two-component system sensor histidine kinase KdpD